jgi:hypothetical protein
MVQKSRSPSSSDVLALLLAALTVGRLASVIPFLLYNAAIVRVTATAAGLVLAAGLAATAPAREGCPA